MTDDSFSSSVLDRTVAQTREIDECAEPLLASFALARLPASARSRLPVGPCVEGVRDIVGVLVTAGIAPVEGARDDDLAVVGAEGVTVNVTPHQLVLEGQPLHTWCAFDAVGIPAALGADAVATSGCPTCSAAIELRLPKGQPPNDPAVGWWPQATSGPVNESFSVRPPTCSAAGGAPGELAGHEQCPAGGTLPLTALAERARATWSLFTDSGDGR